MKKLIFFILLFVTGFNVTSATWTIDGDYNYIEPGTVTSCSLDALQVGNPTGTGAITSLNTINTVCGENNPITVLTNQTGAGTITEAGNIMNGPIGYVIYFILGLSLLGVVIYTIKTFFGNSQPKKYGTAQSRLPVKKNGNWVSSTDFLKTKKSGFYK